MDNEKNDDVGFRMHRRNFSDWEKGLLMGVAIGGVLGPSICLLILILFVCYDLYADKIIYYASGYISNRAGNFTGKPMELLPESEPKIKLESEPKLQEKLRKAPPVQEPSRFRPSINIPMPNITFGMGSNN